MTPGIAAAAPGDAASPFSGTDLCAGAGWLLLAGGRRPVFDDDVWCFGDVDGLAVQLSEGDVRMEFPRSAIRAGGWSPRNTCWPGCCPATSL